MIQNTLYLRSDLTGSQNKYSESYYKYSRYIGLLVVCRYSDLHNRRTVKGSYCTFSAREATLEPEVCAHEQPF